MSIKTTLKKSVRPYTVIDRQAVQDQRLSFRARGILAYLLSKPDGWVVSMKDIQNNGLEGRDAIRKCMKELKENGYAALENIRGEDGKITGRAYIITDRPKDGFSVGRTERRKTSRTENQSVGFPGELKSKEVDIKEVDNKEYSLPIKEKPENLTELKRFINQKNLSGDTITNRMEIFKAAEKFLSSAEFLDQFNFINSRNLKCDPKQVFQEWVTHAPYLDVKEMRINKISARWIQNSINNENDNSRIPTKPNFPPKVGPGSLRNVKCKL